VGTNSEKVNPSIRRSAGVLTALIIAVLWAHQFLSNTDWIFFFSSLACLVAYTFIGELSVKHFSVEKMLAIIRVVHLTLFVLAIFLFSISMANAVNSLLNRKSIQAHRVYYPINGPQKGIAA
jgi:hypothetical protein